MKIRVVIRYSTVRPSCTSPKNWSALKQLACGISGHRTRIEVGTGKLSLKCARCGWESPGWAIESKPALTS